MASQTSKQRGFFEDAGGEDAAGVPRGTVADLTLYLTRSDLESLAAGVVPADVLEDMQHVARQHLSWFNGSNPRLRKE